MLLGKRLRELREAKKLTQGDVQRVTGLTRPYISRVENGRSVPGVAILEKWARAFDMPLYELMHDGEQPPAPLKVGTGNEETLWGDAGTQAAELDQLRGALSKMDDRQRNILLSVVHRMVRRPRSK